MSLENYRGIREMGLDASDERGSQMMAEADTTMDFAVRTAEYGQDYRDLLRQEASDDVEAVAARFVGYEMTEKARKAGINSIETGFDDVETTVDLSDNWIEKLYNSFDLVDRLQGGFISDRVQDSEYEPPQEARPGFSFNASNPYRNQGRALQHFTDNDPDKFGELMRYDIFVLNDEWMAYKSGEDVPTVDEAVEAFLTDLGVL